MQPTDDSAQLRQYAENNSDEAFAALVTRHVNLVYSVALRHVGNPQNAEEITQAVFIILAKKAAQLRHAQALSSWLFQTTRLTANNFVRSEARRYRREEEAYMQSVLDESGTEVWPRIAPLLDTAVAGLREKERQAIVLRFYEGRNLREVGLALGASEVAAEKRVSRALEKLRNYFTKRGVSSTTAIIAGVISANSIQAAPVALAKSVTVVAVAKGAAASGSTLTLIKGALKIMAWTKVKTAVVVGVGILLTVGTAATASKWLWFGDNDPAIQSGKYVSALGRVEKADSPPGMDRYNLYPVGLAYCSAPYFKNLNGNKAVSPTYATRDFLTEAITRKQQTAKWNLNDNFFLKDASWFSDGNVEVWGPDGKMSIQKYEPPYDKPFVETRFENLSWTNWNGISMPSSFKTVTYWPDYTSTNVARFKVAATYTGTLEQIRSKDEFSPVPELTARTLITDSRIKQKRRTNPPFSYVSTNRWDFSDAIR